MRPALLPLLVLSLLAPVRAQSDDSAAEQAARAALFRSCGGDESAQLPTGLTPGVYRGTLGNQPITLELTGSTTQQINDRPDLFHPDRYSYDRTGPDIVLERGRVGASTLLAVEAAEDQDTGDLQVRGCLSLTARAGGLQGQWRSVDGRKHFPITLKLVQVQQVPLALPSSPGLLKLRQQDPFTFLRVNHPWVRAGNTVREPLTDVTYPRVPSGTAALNLSLQDRQLALVSDALDCRGGSNQGVNTDRNDFSGSGEVTWNRAGLVSLTETVDYFCGGAHPDGYTDGVTLDARSGTTVILAGTRAAIWPGLTQARLLALYKSRYPHTDTAYDADCQDTIQSQQAEAGVDLFALFLTPAGLAVLPSGNFLPHVVTACAEQVTLPYATIRKDANPNGKYFRALYPR